MRNHLIVITSILATLAANVALDVYTGVPMLIRWAFSLGFGLLITLILSNLSKRRDARINHDALDGL
ncbi:hypothetical protein AL755_03555 (plasmid) [Arthrobacter sp. ERGS1:01]|uniref:hypothetical protein n=1 Tax=Arthrobacter sp. ERGS1:01 TaxID=1704044 RepID=UPI0006B469C4|nr:hypothetical protein [Arthrobacter sp. ERGS1:01]ALE04776.1 hypothetical protein AL755_03555 [Arthrobacter sp. ERGS1:01]